MFTEVPVVSGSSEGLYVPRVVEVELPIPDYLDLDQSEQPSQDDLQHGLASASGVVVRPTAGGLSSGITTGVRTISWRVLENEHVVSLEPLDLAGKSTGFTAISLRSAERISHCLTVSDFKGHSLVVDFFTTGGILYTAELEYAQFEADEPDFSSPDWRVMKRPLAFDYVKPLVMHAAAATQLVLALADGSVQVFDRAAPLAELQSSTLPDPSAPSGFNWFFKGSADRVPGHPDLSLRAAVSLDSRGDILASYSINNVVKLWSLSEKRCLYQQEPLDAAALRVTPSRYLRFDEQGEHLVVVQVSEGVPGFSIYAVDTPTYQLVHVADAAEPDEEYSSWHLCDLVLFTNQTEFELFAAWKSNLSSLVKLVTLPRTSGIATSKVVSLREVGRLLTLPDGDVDQLVAGMFSFDLYSPSTLRTALGIYSGKGPDALSEEPVSLRQAAADAVSAALQTVAPDQRHARLQWLRLDRLCRELAAKSNELLAVRPGAQGLLWVLRSGVRSLVGDASKAQEFEALTRPGKHESTHHEVAAIAALAAVFPKPAWLEFEKRVAIDAAAPPAELSLDKMTRAYQQTVQAVLSAAAGPELDSVRELVATLEPGKLDSILANVLKPQELDAPAEKPVTATPLGAVAIAHLALAEAAAATQLAHRLLLFILVAYSQGWAADGIRLYSQAEALLRSALAVAALRDPIGSRTRVYKPSTSSIEIGAAKLGTIAIEGRQLGELAARSARELDVSRGAFKVYSEIALTSRSADGGVAAIVAPYLPYSAAGTFMRAFGELATPAMVRQGEQRARAVSLAIALKPQPALQFLGLDFTGNGLGTYYLMLAKSCESTGERAVALRFAQLALTATEPAQSGDTAQHLLGLALAAGDLEVAYDALGALQAASSPNLAAAIAQFLETADGLGRSEWAVRDLPFVGMSQQVFSLLSDATDAGSTVGGTPAYKLLYIWCIARQDFVGAGNAIYRAIKSSALTSSDKADVRANYAIVLNALKCAPEQDRWLVVNNQLVTFDDISQESERAV